MEDITKLNLFLKETLHQKIFNILRCARPTVAGPKCTWGLNKILAYTFWLFVVVILLALWFQGCYTYNHIYCVCRNLSHSHPCYTEASTGPLYVWFDTFINASGLYNVNRAKSSSSLRLTTKELIIVLDDFCIFDHIQKTILSLSLPSLGVLSPKHTLLLLD